jgi:RimJ/RimL family protein N-acetyltransferase
MRINEHIGKSDLSTTTIHQETKSVPAISTPKTLLVPYAPHHVPTYHAWMQDADLQAATASEPLTLPEEYAMQQSWRTDNDKLTFIVCLPRQLPSNDITKVQGGVDDSPERMIGDINLFLFEPEDDDDDDDDEDEGGPNSSTEKSNGVVGEIELMIARKNLHRQGYGRAALLSFVGYILDSWAQIGAEYTNSGSSDVSKSLDYLRVKINQSNARSIALFESIGFEQTAAGANYFGEIELRWRPDRSALEKCKGWEDANILEHSEA